MSASAPGLYQLPHAVFLRRLAGATRGTSLDARLGRAAFLVLRLVDLLAPDERPPSPDAFHYQHAATERACRGLPADRPETSHLIGVVESTSDAYHAPDVGLLFPALFAYAHYLEDEMFLEGALDVLETLERVGGDKYRAEDRVAARLRVARVLRKLNRFDEAEGAYEEGRALAAEAGDLHSQLVSRIGQAQAIWGRGNLASAEQSLRCILAEVAVTGDQEVQALAHHALAGVLRIQGRPADAIPHAWGAFEAYSDETSRGRALADLGGLFLVLGNTVAAERALTEAVARGRGQDFATNAMVELMNCASFRRDRIGFHRWLDCCEARREQMPSNILVDYLLKAGIGWGRFGASKRAEQLLAKALQAAESARLHEFVFRIERIKNRVQDCGCEPESESLEAHELETAAVREVSGSLARLES